MPQGELRLPALGQRGVSTAGPVVHPQRIGGGDLVGGARNLHGAVAVFVDAAAWQGVRLLASIPSEKTVFKLVMG